MSEAKTEAAEAPKKTRSKRSLADRAAELRAAAERDVERLRKRYDAQFNTAMETQKALALAETELRKLGGPVTPEFVAPRPVADDVSVEEMCEEAEIPAYNLPPKVEAAGFSVE